MPGYPQDGSEGSVFPREASHPLRGLVDEPAGAVPLIGREAVKDTMEDPQ